MQLVIVAMMLTKLLIKRPSTINVLRVDSNHSRLTISEDCWAVRHRFRQTTGWAIGSYLERVRQPHSRTIRRASTSSTVVIFSAGFQKALGRKCILEISLFLKRGLREWGNDLTFFIFEILVASAHSRRCRHCELIDAIVCKQSAGKDRRGITLNLYSKHLDTNLFTVLRDKMCPHRRSLALTMTNVMHGRVTGCLD